MKNITLACAVVLSLTTLAHAADSAVPAQLVKFGDLDLGRTEGKAALYNRLMTASKFVCRAFDGSVSIQYSTNRSAFPKCVHEALGKAVAKVNQPEFTAYVTAKQPGLAVVQVASR